MNHNHFIYGYVNFQKFDWAVFPNRKGVGRIVSMRKSWDQALKKVGLEGKIYHDFIGDFLASALT